MTLDAHVTGIWCGQIGGDVGRFRVMPDFVHKLSTAPCFSRCRALSLLPSLVRARPLAA